MSDKVAAGIKDALTLGQKIRVGIGTLNLDDVVGGDTENLGAVGQTAMTKPFTLAFSNASGSESYEIFGNLVVKPVPIDFCQTQVNAVRAAQAVLDGIDDEIRLLQEELQTASSQSKPGIIARIKQEREQVPAAKAVLQRANQALEICRAARQPPVLNQGAGIVV